MKQKLLLIIYALMTATVAIFLSKELLLYAEHQNIRYQEAIRIVKCDCIRKMNEAEKERNVHKMIYYHYQYQNAAKLVIDLGSDSIINNY